MPMTVRLDCRRFSTQAAAEDPPEERLVQIELILVAVANATPRRLVVPLTTDRPCEAQSCRIALVNPVDHVRQHAQALDPADEPTWLAVGKTLGVSAFEAKAYYTVGLVREMVATAGLARSKSLHLGAIFQVLGAIELLGRAVGGFRHAKGEAGPRLRAGLNYALDLNDQQPTPLDVQTADKYVNLRNFTGHGAATAGGPLSFDPWSGLALLHLTTRALDAMWADAAKMAAFAKCQIDPMVTPVQSGQTEAIYVRDIQAHLQAGKLPSKDILFDNWRGEEISVVWSAAAPAVTGF
jgi:hypothetical protein